MASGVLSALAIGAGMKGRRGKVRVKRKLVLMSTLLAALLTGEARAQIPVVDASAIARLVQQAQTAAQQLQQLQQQYNQMVQQYNSLAKLTNIGSLEPELLSALNQNPMFQDANQAFAFLNGVNGLGGAGQISSYAQNLFNQNHVYTPSGAGFIASEMTRNATPSRVSWRPRSNSTRPRSPAFRG
jgi:hypothetical protein